MKKKLMTLGVVVALWAGFFNLSSIGNAEAAQTFKGQEIQVNYPEGWTAEEYPEQVNLYRSAEAKEWVQVDIDSSEAFLKRSTVDIRQADALDKMIAAHKKAEKGFKLIESKKIETAQRQGYFYICTTLKAKHAVMDFIQGDKVYSLQFSASQRVFDEQWEQVKTVFDSVEVVN